ncbi:ABC transporter ATP-binding protein [Aciditerrimonas ferrireducens]|uniref:ABC transporter ATP-binding protein n=1 Tax=Aciditerrimonas ferrireducens TaxID=667306 RepID=A0ABV6C3U2_9ACTN|nr:ABC transporter ATP-binding protein [Aciditerrimonas ferrireducens]MCK4177365.1 ABC transporter ATP-binding protein [Aciditerrimonas ferrireducens]
MIQVRGVTKRYGRVTAVEDLSFDVPDGRVTGFLGPNGSGKSTTMRIIVGLDRPDAGSALVDGRPYRDLPWPLREVGALLDARGFHPGRSARRHLQALARAGGLPASRVEEVLDLVGLGAVADRRAGTFSLGMGQRLGIAAALLGDPPTLLFDEPVNGLDPEGIRWVRTLLRRLAAEGRCVLVSSHLLAEMALTADHLVVVGRGRLVAETSMAAFLEQYAPARVRVASPEVDRLARAVLGAGGRVEPAGEGRIVVSGLHAAAIGELAHAEGVVLHELSPDQAGLEEAFLQTTAQAAEYRGGAA